MDLYEFLTSARNATILQARVDALCKGRTMGESLTLSMLYTVLEALENDDGDFAEDVAAINKDRLHHRTLLFHSFSSSSHPSMPSMPPHDHACTKEIVALEDLRSINRRKRTYCIKLLLTKTRLPEPAKILISTSFLRAPLHAATRAAPSKFTLTQEFRDGAGSVWTCAPYTAEAWRGSFR